MIFYVTIFGLMVLLRYALMRRPKARSQIYPVLLLSLFVFSAFRFEVGCDWLGYLNQWEIQKSSTARMALLRVEPVWWSMMQGPQSVGLPYPWLNVTSSAIFFLGIHVLAKRQPDPLSFLILLFPILIINMPMSGIRQGAAIGIMCFAFSAFIDKRLFRFSAWTLLAAGFHNSAIIFLLLIPLVGGNYTKKRLLMAAVLSIPGGLAIFGGDAATGAVNRYVGTGYDAAGAAFRVGLLLVSGLGYFVFLRKKWKRTFPRDYKIVSVGALIMCAAIVLVPISTIIADRIGYYFIPIQTMIFARIPYLPIRKSRALLTALPYLALGLLFAVWTAFSELFAQCYVPYQSWVFGLPASAGYAY